MAIDTPAEVATVARVTGRFTRGTCSPSSCYSTSPVMGVRSTGVVILRSCSTAPHVSRDPRQAASVAACGSGVTPAVGRTRAFGGAAAELGVINKELPNFG
ncbi:hypothetical protein GCM10023317_80300 [Actinopolymorpha pittospori]